MRRIYLFFAISFISTAIFAQLNMTQLGHLPYTVNLSDVWGYVDEVGNEYALVGARNGLSVVDVTDPGSPSEVFFGPGPISSWRDVKTWGDYAYVSNESTTGIYIVDLNPLPGAITTTTNFTGSTYPFVRAHNIYIDEFGKLYIMGANNGFGGVIICDLTADPMNPVELGRFNDYYIHDGMARGDTLWGSAIYGGILAAIDVSNPANPVVMGTVNTPSQYTHNAWVSDDGKYVYTTDEVSGGYIGAYNVENLSAIFETDRIRTTTANNVIPHNAHVMNDFIISSYYSDGIIVHDASNPNNLFEVANFDTSPTYTSGFHGVWGAYPFLPSGNILASDMEGGLYILGADYLRAAFLEGMVTDSISGDPLFDVDVEIMNASLNMTTAFDGTYSIGTTISGIFNIQFSKADYHTKIIENVEIINGEITDLDVLLRFGAEDLWIGNSSNDWNLGTNWLDGNIPTATDDVIIPSNPLGGYFPETNNGLAAECFHLTIEADAHLFIPTDNALKVNGDLRNVAGVDGLVIKSDASGNASFIEYGSPGALKSATVEKYISADMYHSYSPTVSGLTATIFYDPAPSGMDVYLYGQNELNNSDAFGGYYEIIDVNTNLNPMTGYAVYPDGANANPAVSGGLFIEQGILNSGAIGGTNNLTQTGAGEFAGFNYVGNPFPSFIDWNAPSGWNKTQIDATIWAEADGNWAQYTFPGPGVNGGSNIIAPGQGFFVKVDAFANGTIMMDNSVRTNTSTPFLKNAATNYITLVASGNNKTDEMVVRFDENATALFDSQYDGAKLAADNNNYPQIYSIADRNLAYNALPETDLVQMGFYAGIDGEYTIHAKEIIDIPSVWLEDTFTGIVKNLSIDSYTFGYSTNDPKNRFVLHFSPLSVDDNFTNGLAIYSFNQEVYIKTPELTSGDIFVYNIMGQEIAQAEVTDVLNKITLTKGGYYIVKVINENTVTSKKVYIK